MLISFKHVHGVFFDTALSEVPSSKPYQGVRVKDPVKELLRRKRGNAARTKPPSTVGTTAHVCTHNRTHAFFIIMPFKSHNQVLAL